MEDSFGRTIDYIRISVTDRCNLRCVYCMPETGVEKLVHGDILSYEDILRLCHVLVELGITKVKITGGEPLVRKNVAGLIAGIKAIPGIRSVTMTTNGQLLGPQARQLKAAGLDGVNISLDTMDPVAYRRLTRCGELKGVLEGLDAAVEVGIPSVKVNCVPMGPQVDREGLTAIASLARDRAVQVRYIELMPVGLGAAYTGVDNAAVRECLEAAYGLMTPCEQPLGNGPAQYASLPGFRGRIGFISAVGSCFCESCNRVRLTADGTLKACLHADDGVNLKEALASDGDRALRERIQMAIWRKPQRHHFFEEAVAAERRRMNEIGG